MEKQTRLFVACSLALVSVAFGFIIRAFLINQWQVIFNLSKTQIGSIQGAGLYPNALAMIFLSLIVDRIGYGRVIAFAWVVQSCFGCSHRDGDGLSRFVLGRFFFPWPTVRWRL